MTEPDLQLPFECPNCGAHVEYRVWRKAFAERTHPWADYRVSEENCNECGEQVTVQLKGVADV